MKAKENIRIWFEFYKLSLHDDRFKKHIEISKHYYADWGNIRDIKFDNWWKDHKQLFDEVTIREIDQIDNDKSAIYLKIPLLLPITDLAKRFVEIVTDKQSKIRKSNTKSKAVSSSKYSLTAGTEFRAERNNHALMIYRDVFLQNNRPPINTKFISKIKAFYEGRKAIKFKKMPVNFANFDPNDENELIVRNCRRYIRDAEKLMLAAAQGDFPGKGN